MESWSVGFDGNDDVERHAGAIVDQTSSPTSVGQGPSPDTIATQRPAVRLRMVSDYICPWCYVGLARLEHLRSEFDIQLDVNAYMLRPNTPPEGIARAEASKNRIYPPGYIENLLQTARDAGIDMKRPGLIPNTRKAHETTQFAREHGKTWEIERALFQAYFEEERNIGDIDVLADVAASIGLDADELRHALTDGRYAQAVDEELAWAAAIGVTGVPTVVFNETFAVVGAQEYETFRDVAQRVASGRLDSDESHATA